MERFHTHRLGRDQCDDGRVTRLDEFGKFFLLASFSVCFLLDFGKLAGNVGCVKVKHRTVSIVYFTRVVQNNHLKESMENKGLVNT